MKVNNSIYLKNNQIFTFFNKNQSCFYTTSIQIQNSYISEMLIGNKKILDQDIISFTNLTCKSLRTNIDPSLSSSDSTLTKLIFNNTVITNTYSPLLSKDKNYYILNLNLLENCQVCFDKMIKSSKKIYWDFNSSSSFYNNFNSDKISEKIKKDNYVYAFEAIKTTFMGSYSSTSRPLNLKFTLNQNNNSIGLLKIDYLAKKDNNLWVMKEGNFIIIDKKQKNGIFILPVISWSSNSTLTWNLIISQHNNIITIISDSPDNLNSEECYIKTYDLGVSFYDI